MLCARAVRNLVHKRLLPSRYWAIQNPRHLHNFSSINNRILSNEAKAVQKILAKSKLNGIQVARICGVRSFHTSHTDWNKNDDEKKKQDEDDDKERIMSALKTAVGFLAVPLMMYFVFFSGQDRRRENMNWERENRAQSMMRDSGMANNLNQSSRDPTRRFGPAMELQWNEFYQNLLMRGEVEEIIIHPGVNRVTAILHPGAVYKGKTLNRNIIHISVPSVDRIEAQIREAEQSMGISAGNGVSVVYERRAETNARIIISMIALGIAVMFIRFMSKNVSRMSMGSMNPFSKMTKADFTLIDPSIKQGKGVKFADVAGLKEPKVEVLEFVDYLKDPSRFIELGAKPPKGAILLGPPGCGKTMLAKAVANEANVPFLSMNGSEFIEMIGGLGASRVRNLFAEARKRAPSIIFIDEIDAIGRKRSESGQGGGMGNSNSEGEQTLNQLLVEMDGMSSTSNVILLASTNRADVLDNALLRPGRFDRHISIDLPTLIERKEIVEKHLDGVVLEKSPSQYSERLAQLTPGFSGADLANLVNEAALHAARDLQKKVQTHNLEYAIERVIAGPEKKTKVLSPHERKVVAYHESGHALVGWMLEHTDALLKVTIIPRTSAALGFAQYTPLDKKLFSPEEFMDRMCMALGGRVAESLTFNKITTGAQSDLDKVTKMAYAQIREFGFSENVGLMSFDMSGGGKKPYSKKLAATMDLEARQMIAEAYKRTEAVLMEHGDKLELLAQRLLEVETLNYADVVELIGPPPHGKKHLVSPVEYEHGLKQQSEMGDKGQSMGGGT